MGYRERFEKYTEGKLEGTERADIDNDIEKQQVIAEYLDSRLDAELFEGSDAGKGTEDAKLSEFVKKAVGRKLRKYSVCVGLVVLAIVLFLMFGLSPLMDAMYFNPRNDAPGYQHPTDVMDLPLTVYTELHDPGEFYAFSRVEPKGYGNYDITLYLDRFIGGIETVESEFTMEKGKCTELSKLWSNNYGMVHVVKSLGDNLEGPGLDVNELNKLPETTRLIASVSFSKDLELSEVKQLAGNGNIKYLPIRTSDNLTDSIECYGILPARMGYSSAFSYDEEAYPDLSLDNVKSNSWDVPVEAWEQHFKSMLKYMADRKDFDNAFGLDAEEYSKALEYVEKNGVKAYGMILRASAKDMIKLSQDKRINTIMVFDAKLSNYSM